MYKCYNQDIKNACLISQQKKTLYDERRMLKMKKQDKRLMVCVLLLVTLFGNCLSAAAETNSCKHNTVTVYSKELSYREFLFTHTEQHVSTSVICNVYNEYYTVIWKCVNCGAECMVTTEKVSNVHIY